MKRLCKEVLLRCLFLLQAPSGYPSAGPMGGMPPHNQGHTQHRGMPPGPMPPGPMPMNSPMQQQKRIDPDQMPSPVS